MDGKVKKWADMHIKYFEGQIKDEILKRFREMGYNIECKILIAADYGVPQNRRRVIFVGSIYNDNYEYPVPSNTDATLSSSFIDKIFLSSS